jgi:hypothetical protein
MTQPALLVDRYSCEQPLAKICAECENAQKKEMRAECENVRKMRHLSDDPMASKIWSRWIHGELQAPI